MRHPLRFQAWLLLALSFSGSVGFSWDRLCASEPLAGITADPNCGSCSTVLPPVRDVACSLYGEADPDASGAYSQLFYNNDFSYLDDRCRSEWHLGDRLKNLCLVPGLNVDLGGEYRARFHHEDNLRAKRLSGRSDDFLLHRTRLYMDAETENVRIYAEALDATSDGHRFQPRATEVNRFDAINLFADIRLLTNETGEYWLRGGRQEMTFGSQRLVSNRPWRNTTVTFDGFRGFWRGEQADVDLFWTRPIPFAQHLPHDRNFDSPDQSRQFFGAFATRSISESTTLDLFYFGLDEDDVTRQGNASQVGPFSLHTVGTRYLGQACDWFVELEGGVQFGELAGADHQAGYFVAGVGRQFTAIAWQPTVWAFYDWASGDSDPTRGKSRTFRHLFPRGHYYLAFTDLTGRQNIEDFNVRLEASPSERLSLTLWWHVLRLEERRDAVYSPGGGPIYHDPSGSAGNDLGHALDVAASWDFSPRLSFLAGYSRLFAGSYFDNAVIQGGPSGIATNGSSGNDGTLVYLQASLRF